MTITHTTLLQEYCQKVRSYDEVLDRNGELKPHWQSLFAALEGLGLKELGARNQEIITTLQENGVTYSVYESSDGLDRPWQLDPIPFLIHQNEWQQIARGLRQRAELMNLILKDLYGPQTLIKEKVIPPELVYDNTGFLRACHDVKLAGNHQLVKYAVDMARGPDGRMWVLDNRTQAPSGSGYALENRTVMSKVLPDLAENLFVRRLSPFYLSTQQAIARVFGRGKEDLTIVYLTPGPKNETYFEHAYLASYYGYILAQGDDLLVRDGFVWLKSIEGLQKVDIILRRIDDDFSDPLELRSDSRLGVPGLLHAIRMGKVAVINPPGTGLLENNALMAFMHNACQHLLGEEPILPSVATWWCGQSREKEFVLENLHKLIIKKANRHRDNRSIYGKTLSTAQVEQLKKEIRANPAQFVAQQEVSFSTTPAFVNDSIEPRFAALRAYLIGTENDYVAMPGGLTRSSPEAGRFTFSNQYGGISKDTWIVGSEVEETRENIVLPTSTNYRKASSLPSRSADNLFWVGRYGERVLATNAFINILLNALNVQQNYGGKAEHISWLLRSLTHLTLTYPGFVGDDARASELLDDPVREINDLVLNAKRMGTIGASVERFLRAIKSVRDQWNPEISRAIDLIEGSLVRIRTLKKEQADHRAVQKDLDRLYSRMFTFYGAVSETMPRDNAYYLLKCGKLIERILSRVSVIRSTFAFRNPEYVENELLEALLNYHHLLGRFRNTYRSQISLSAGLDMILLEANSPYALAYQFDALGRCLARLPGNHNRLNNAQKAVLEAAAKIKLADVVKLCEYEEKSNFRKNLDELMAEITALTLTASESISNLYFSHVAVQNSFIGGGTSIEHHEI
ncbi:circularly permuted type 2 ATP-grasp protein [Persicitalea sp.]|uniref:circularly permuted type 2 ATP-grasp protein n=1 Tax=Persicitalea sp. TaxID=3100273 RepID=UPI00359470B7